MLRTERLTLVRLTDDELRAIRDGDRDGRPWAVDYPSDGDRVIAGLFVDAPALEMPWAHFQACLEGVAIGGIGFHGEPRDGAVEIGYGLVPSARGKGFATEAVRALLELARSSGAASVIATTDADNRASEAVLERCGFTRGPEGWVLVLVLG